MGNEKSVRIAFFISLTGHLLLFGIPKDFFKSKSNVEIPKEVVIRIETKTLPLLPKIEKIGKEKKLKKIIPEPESFLPPEEKIISRFEPRFERPILPKPKIKREIGKIVLPKPEPPEIVHHRTNGEQSLINEAMLRYQDMVKQRIESARHYPSWARKEGMEGKTFIKFIILSSGKVKKINLIRSSGFQILDKEAIATIKRANPFPPLPKEKDTSPIQMEVSLVFTLKFDI